MTFAEKLNQLYNYLEPLVSILDFMSVFIILWGFFVGFMKFISIEFFHHQGKYQQYQELRRTVGIYIILGLEFMVVSDLLHTVQGRTYKAIAILGSLVVIRTIISYFLGKEMKEAGEEAGDFKLGLRAVNLSKESSLAAAEQKGSNLLKRAEDKFKKASSPKSASGTKDPK